MDKVVRNRSQDTDGRAGFRPVDAPEQELERALHLLSTVEGVLDDDVSYSRVSARDVETVDASLVAAQDALSAAWGRWTSGDRAADTARMAAVLLQVGIMRSSLQDSSVAQQRTRVSGLAGFLHNLRLCSALPELLDRAPVEISRLGLSRVLLSRVEEGTWIARSGAVIGHPDLARDMVRVGTEHPGSLTGAQVETDMVRRRTPILVHDARSNPRVHPELRALIDCRAYVSAPVIATGKVVGLLHADENVESGTVDVFDRDMLGVAAESLGSAMERTMFFERLQGLRRKLDENYRTVTDLVDEFVEADVAMASPETGPGALHPPAQSGRDAVEGALTKRELEVLRLMATGRTNAQIANDLFVSEGTVKTHAKHILRKLGAANRAEAVSRYHLRKRS